LHGDRFGQQGIQPPHPGRIAADGVGIQMHDLLQGMDTRIGAAGTDRGHRRRRQKAA
jgi:hypothetical protein